MVNHYIVGRKQFIGRAVVKGVGPGRGGNCAYLITHICAEKLKLNNFYYFYNTGHTEIL